MSAPKKASSRRKPGTGPARKGSRFQLQLYVDRYPELLNEAITTQVPELAKAEISWVSPLAASKPDAFHEYQDAAFLKALGLGDAKTVDALGRFWPKRGGPQWDGLATIRLPRGRTGQLLVEAKANVPELLGGRSTSCAAGAASLRTIKKALAETRTAIGATGSEDAWVGPLYQTANRLAHLHFLRAKAHQPDTWLIHLLFESDPTYRPTTRADWEQALAKVDAKLGLPDKIPGAEHVFLPGVALPTDWRPARDVVSH